MKALLRFSLISILTCVAPLSIAAVSTLKNAEEKIPNLPLTQEIFFKVLVSEMALQAGNLGAAWELDMDLAEATRDPRFAKRALEIGLTAQQPEQSLISARLWHDISPRSEAAAQSLRALLVLQNRLPEFERLAKKELAATSKDKRPALLLEMYEQLSRGSDKTAIVNVFETLLKMDKPRAETQLALARVYIRAGQAGPAKRALEYALRLKPDFALAVLMLADMQRQEGQTETAQALLQDFIEVEQKSHVAGMQRMVQVAYQILAQIAEDNRDFDAAEKWLSKITLLDLHFSAQAQRARLLIRQGKGEAAKQLFAQLHQQAGLTEQQQRDLLQMEVSGWVEVKAYDQAIAKLQKQLQIWPQDADLWYELAMVQEKVAQYDVMEQSLRTAIKFNPKMAQAYNALAYSMADRNERLPEARALIEKALSFIPNDPYFLDSMGWIEYRQGNLQEAKDWLQRAFIARSDTEIGVHLAEVLWRLGEENDARDLLRNMQMLDADNEVLKQTLQRLLKPGEAL